MRGNVTVVRQHTAGASGSETGNAAGAGILFDLGAFGGSDSLSGTTSTTVKWSPNTFKSEASPNVLTVGPNDSLLLELHNVFSILLIITE
jgi:hypothetical protein